MSATPISLPAPSDNHPAPSENHEESLAAAPLFKGLPSAVIEAISDSADIHHYSDGQTVYAVGQYDGAEFFVILKGRMKISIIDSDSGSMLIEQLGPDEAFGLDFVFGDANPENLQNLSITAEEDMSVLTVDAEAFRTLAAQRPSLMRNIAVYFARDLNARRFRNVNAEAAAEQRIFSVLLRFVERDAVSGLWRVPRMPKHRELADEAGVEEALAAAAVAQLIQEDVARRDYPGLIIADLERLNQLAAQG